MYPPFVQQLKEMDPELYHIVTQNWDLALKPGQLDGKTKALMILALDAVLGSAEGVKTLAASARSNGATEAEISETVRIAYMVASNHTLVTSLQAFKK